MAAQRASDGMVALDVGVEQTMTRVRSVLGRSDRADVEPGHEELFEYLAGQLVEFHSDRGAPIVSVVRHVGNYWRNWLLVILRTGAYRPSTIGRLLAALDPTHPISQRMLTLNLRLLERDGLIRRRVISDERKNVEYALTPLGDELSDLLMSVIQWGDRHSDEIARARDSFDAGEAH